MGNRASLSYVNGTRADYAYNAKNQLLSIRNVTATSTISSYTYTLDPRGLRLGVTEDTGRTVGYTYDGLRRLTKETIVENGTQTDISYALDAVGNRLEKSVTAGTAPVRTTSYSYNANDELTTENGADGLVQYVYDANGQTTQKMAASGSATYAWDFEGRLVGASSPGQALAFGYDADGIRTAKSVNGALTSFVVDKNRDYAQVLEERDGTGSLQVGYVYGDDLLSQERSTGVSFYHVDGQLSTRQLSDVGATITDQYAYDAFGLTLSSLGSTTNPYLYGGQQSDSETGLYYLRARHYSQTIGRFISQDPLQGTAQDPLTLHRYLYGGGNPVMNADPSGQWFIAVVLSIAFVALLSIATVGQYGANTYRTNVPSGSYSEALTTDTHSLEIINSHKSVDEIFARLAEFHVDRTIATPSGNVPVTGVGSRIKWTLEGFKESMGQAPFYVTVQGFSNRTGQEGLNDHFMYVGTMFGHPLSGWRFWRVYRKDSSTIIVETGAVDEPAGPLGALKRSSGGHDAVLKLWRYMLLDALDFSKGAQGTGPLDNVGGRYAPERKLEFLGLFGQ